MDVLNFLEKRVGSMINLQWKQEIKSRKKDKEKDKNRILINKLKIY